MQQFFRRVWTDIKARRNIESYIISFLAAGLSIFTVVDMLPVALFGAEIADEMTTALVLASLSVLVLNITAPEKSSGKLDDYLDDRSNLGTFAERIKGASRLYIYAPSAANILQESNAQAVRQNILAKKDGELRVVIQNPDRPAAMKILIDQLDRSTIFQTQSLPQEIQRTLGQFQLIEQWDIPGTFAYRLLDYGPGFSLVVIDPHKSNGQIIVEFHGAQNESTHGRMHIELTKQGSERWFMYWERQFEHIWERGKPATDAELAP